VNVERSNWEAAIERYIRSEFPRLRIETNNRNVIPSRKIRNSYLEIDLFIPELSLGIEANGETFHDREQYRSDLMRSTEHSDEMYKQNHCERVGIELIHVWSSEDMETIQVRVGDAIRRRLADPTIEEWHQATWASRLADASGRLQPVDWVFMFLFGIPGLVMTILLTSAGEGGEWLFWSWVCIIASWVFYRWVASQS